MSFEPALENSEPATAVNVRLLAFELVLVCLDSAVPIAATESNGMLNWLRLTMKGVWPEFGIRPITVALAQAENLIVSVGDQNGMLVAGDLLAGTPIGFDKTQQLLAVGIKGEHDLAFDWAA